MGWSFQMPPKLRVPTRWNPGVETHHPWPETHKRCRVACAGRTKPWWNDEFWGEIRSSGDQWFIGTGLIIILDITSNHGDKTGETLCKGPCESKPCCLSELSRRSKQQPWIKNNGTPLGQRLTMLGRHKLISMFWTGESLDEMEPPSETEHGAWSLRTLVPNSLLRFFDSSFWVAEVPVLPLNSKLHPIRFKSLSRCSPLLVKLSRITIFRGQST